MSLFPQINPQTLKFPTYSQLIKGITILALILPFFFSPSAMVSAQTSTEETQIYTYHVYLPILKEGPQPYFVSPSGNDINPGTFLLPWRTLSKAAHMVKPGDIVYVRGGVYIESASFSTSGTASSLIRILAYPGEYPIIDGGNTIPGPGGSLLSINGDYIYASGLEIRNSAYAGIHVLGNYDTVDNMYVHHSQENGILINKGHNSTVQNSRVWRNSLTNEFGQRGGWSSGLSAARDGVTYAIIRGNIVWENWGEGISVYEADHTVIEENIIHDNFTANIYLSDTTNVLLQRNFIYIDPTSYVFPYGVARGIMMGDERYDPPSSNISIINNISVGNRINLHWWQGVQGGGMHNVLIANNTFVNAIRDANVAFAEGSHQNVVFTNNIVQQDGSLPIINVISNPEFHFSYNQWSKIPINAASGTGDIIGDPLLAQIENLYSPTWYTLTSVSPAIDQALSISEVNVDFFGIYREVPPDIGANEFFPTH